MKKLQFVNFFRVVFLLLMFSAFSSNAWAESIPANTTLYLDAGDWNKDGAGFAAYFFENGEEWVSMTQVSGNIFKVTSPNKSYPKIIFVRMNGANKTGWDNKWNQTNDITDYTSGKNLCTITNHWNNKASWSWSTYSGEDTGGDSGGSSVVLPTEKGDCERIEIYSKDNYNLYVFNDSHIGPDWGSTKKGESVTYNGSSYYKWTICDNEYVHIIFQNGDRSKQSGDSPKLYGGYAYIFDGEYVSDSKPVPNPSSFEEVNCSATGSCYNSSSADDDEDDYIDALKCDPANTKIIFTETFGTFTNNDDRTSYSRTLASHGYVARVGSNYSAMATKCTAIKDAGKYAVLANPKWAGCGKQSNGDTHACECNDSWWYKGMEDHTEGDTNGGMLMFNCNDGTTTIDVLYECELEVCAETYINFSAWIAPANALRDGCGAYQNAGVKFILKDKNNPGEPIATKTIKDIDLNKGWQEIAVMFNAGEADNATGDKKEVVLQFINVAVDGDCGNDLLIDDITLSVCTPQAVLETSNGTPTSTILLGKTETLTAEITSGLMDDPYYLWQVSDTRTGTWINLTDGAVQNRATYTVAPDSPNLQYRVIIAPSLEDIAKGLANVNTNNDVCGMYAITNVATVTSKVLALAVSAPDNQICVDGEDNTTIEISVTNPLGTKVTEVTVNIDNLADFTATKTSGAGTYSAGVWTIGDIAAGVTQTLKLKLISTKSITASSSRFLQSYVKTVSGISYSSYADAPDDSKKETQVTLNPLPEALFSVNKETICDGSTTSEIAINVNKGTHNYTLTVDGEDYSTSTVPYILKVTPSTTKTYTLTQVKDSKGCIYKPTQNNTATVTVEKLSITTQPTTQTVCVGGKATFKVVAEGANKYTWEVSKDNKTWELIADASTTSSTYTTPAVTADDNGKYYRVNVCKDGGKCGIITSNSAELIVTTIDKPTLLNNGKYDECSTTGDISLSTLFSGTALKYYSDSELKSEITTGKFSASEIVKDKPYYATQTINGCTSDAAVATVTVKENPTLNSVLLDKTAICGTDANSKAILSYNISGGLAPYTLYIDRTEAGVTETVNPNNLSTTGTRELKPSSDATYKFTKVVDANDCESTSDKTLSIDVQAINVTANISDVNVCADKTKLFTVEANGDNLNYKWSESTNGGETFSQVGTNSNEYTTGTFSMGDQKQYKVEVYQNPEVCKAVEGLSKVTVQDCSGFEIDYSAVTSATVCKGNNITLKVTLTNNADEAANSVDVKITNISNQTLVSRNPSVGSYTHNTGIWSIPSLASDATATLTIEIKGNVVATDLVSKAYVVKSGSTSYTEATTKADDSQSITIKDITLAPTLISETYKDCPKVGMLNLSTQVSSDATGLKFYTTETGSNTATQANTNTIGTTTYWVSNTKVGECESPRTKLDIVVYPQPTATLSGSSTICKGESANLTVQLTGKENYIITLSNGDIKPNVSGSSTQMAVSPDLTTNYTLRNVTDGNGCVATLSGSAKVTVNDVPVIEFTENPLPEYCAGVEYTLPTPNVDNKGSNVTESAWYLADNKLSSNKIKFTTDDNAKSLIYKAKNTCGETTATFVASLNVADCAELTLTYSLDKSSYCEEDDAVLTATLYNGSALDLNNVVVTNSWAGKQTFVLSEVSKGTYNNNTWTINKLTKGETVTLTISFKVVEAEEFKIYVSQANGETYTFDTSVAKSTTQLVVKDFSFNVTVNNYINCPIDANSFLITDLVTSDKNDLKVWTKNAATGLYEKVNEVPTINPNQTTPAATYYITNTERGKCESTTPSPVTVEVFPQPTAVLSGSATICKGESTDLTVTLTGKEKFNITLSNGDTKQDVSGNSVNMTVSPDLNTTYILRSVTDGNGCYATLSGDAIVTVNDEAIISDITAPAAICAGEPLSLPTPVITENGSVVTGGKWYLGGVEYTEGESVPDSKNGMMLQYKAQSSCGGEIKSNEVAITVNELPALKFESPTSTICIDGTLNASDKQQTSAKVLFTAGEPTYKFSYSIGNKNYDDIEVTGTSHIIAHDIDADANITISKVVDTHGCVTKYNDVIHKVETQKHATLSTITAPETVCETDKLALTTPTVTNNGARVDGEKWVLDNSDFDPATPMDYDIHNNKDLFYQINSYCNDIKRVVPSNKVKVTVYDQPEETSAGEDQAECGVSEFYLNAEEASAGSGKWIVASDSSEEWLKDVKFEDDTDPKTKVYGIPEGKSVTLMWTVSNGTCTPMSDLVQITNNMIPVLSEEITSVNSLDKDSIGYKETIELTCFNDKLYLIPSIKDAEGNDYSTDKLDFSWSKQDGTSFVAYGEGKTEIVREEGTYKLQVKDKATGCTSGVSYITIEDKKITPVINNITSYTMSETGEATDVESNIINCYNPVLIIKPSLDNTDNIKYEWSTGSVNDTIHVIREGDYFLKVQNTVSGCYAEEVKYSITENKRTPIIEDIISVNSTDKTVEGYKETEIINCKDTELFISSVIKDNIDEEYSPEELEYEWTISKDNGENYKEYGTTESISTTSKAIFKLVVTDKETGCPAEAKTIEITENLVKPVISYIESYETINPTGTGIKEEDVLTCKKPVIYLRPTIEESTDVSYKWSDDSTEDYLKVVEQGTYGLVVKDNTSFCSSDEVTFSVTENKRTPIIEDIISVNSTDETVEGYKETQIINCKDTELFISSVIKDKVETQYSPEELEYDWTVSYDNGEIFEEYGEAATITATEEAIFRLVVTDNLTGCPAEAKTIEITEVKTTPTIKSMTSVSTIDPEAEKVEETNVLTCEYPVLYLKPTIESENEVSYKWNDESTLDYLKVEEKGTYTLIVKDETTFCSSEEYSYDVSENKNAPVLDIQSVYELCPSDTLSAKTLSSLLPNVAGVTYKFYDESGEEIADVYEVSSESSVNSYYVIGTSANGCSSEKASFDVDFAKNVDFTLTASQTSMMIGGNETVVTITPDADSDIATSYIWTANDEEIDVDGLEFVDNLYIDTNFKVTASNRCDSDTKEAFIEVLWPTAFTPHNGNGKNDSFADGMNIIVFNRFYTKIYEGPDGWDGSINGAMNDGKETAVPGVYYYSVQLPNGQVKKGTIEIVKVD